MDGQVLFSNASGRMKSYFYDIILQLKSQVYRLRSNEPSNSSQFYTEPTHYALVDIPGHYHHAALVQ